MDRREDARRNVRLQYFSSIPGDAEGRTKNGLGGGCAKAHQQSRLNEPKLRLEPRTARSDLARVRLFVQPPFPARLPFEVFYGVRYVDLRTIYPRFLQGAVE